MFSWRSVGLNQATNKPAFNAANAAGRHQIDDGFGHRGLPAVDFTAAAKENSSS